MPSKYGTIIVTKDVPPLATYYLRIKLKLFI